MKKFFIITMFTAILLINGFVVQATSVTSEKKPHLNSVVIMQDIEAPEKKSGFKLKPIKNIFLKNDAKPKSDKPHKITFMEYFKKQNAKAEADEVTKAQILLEQKRVYDISQQATALYNDNNLEESLKTFLKIPEDGRTAQDNLLVGNILLDFNKPEDAVFMYKRALLVDETYYKAYYNIGNICLGEDKFFMAIDQYKKVIKYAPEFPYGYYNLACAYIKAGELRKAKSKLIKAIELKKTEPDFHYNLAYVYKKLNKEKSAKVYLENYNKLTNGQ